MAEGDGAGTADGRDEAEAEEEGEEESEEDEDEGEEPDPTEIVANFRRLESALARRDAAEARQLAAAVQAAVARGLRGAEGGAWLARLEALLAESGLGRDRVAELQREAVELLEAADAAARRPTWLPSSEELARLPRLRQRPAQPQGRRTSPAAASSQRQGPALGEFSGLPLPSSIAALQSLGADWLTKALHSTNALAANEEVASIAFLDPPAAAPEQLQQGAGGLAAAVAAAEAAARRWVSLDAECRRKEGEAAEEEAPATGRRMELWVRIVQLPGGNTSPGFSEVMFHRVFAPGSPVWVPKHCFSDVDQAAGCYVLLLERPRRAASSSAQPLPTGMLLPPCARFRDGELQEPLARYHAAVRALARLAAAYQKGELGDAAALELLPSTRPAARSEAERRKAVEKALGDLAPGLDFATKTCPALFPAEARSSKFLQALEDEYAKVAKHIVHMEDRLWDRREYATLAPVDFAIDCACFWKGEDAELECGVLEWAGVAHVPLAVAFASLLHAGEPGLMRESESQLLQHLVEHLAGCGGPLLQLEELRLQVKIAQLLLLQRSCSELATLYALRPKAEFRRVKGPRDPAILDNDSVRCRALAVVHAFRAWREGGVYQALREWQWNSGLRQLPTRQAPGTGLFGEVWAAPEHRRAGGGPLPAAAVKAPPPVRAGDGSAA